jgi:sulfonate transport system substrate-binding protein
MAESAAASPSLPAAGNPLLNTLRVGGVPEHFNHLWTIASDRGLFEKYGVRVAWSVQALGTGEMIAGIHRGDLDVIVALTEGVITNAALQPQGPAAAAAAAGAASGLAAAATRTMGMGGLRILGTYVQSPLCWAVSCGPHRDAAPLRESLDALRSQTWAISRPGSGSHLMAFVLARARGWDTRPDAGDLKFKVGGDIHGLIAAVSPPPSGSSEGGGEAPAAAADLFMWETFMTKQWHDKGVIQRVGEFYTPWHVRLVCRFCIAVRCL